MLVANRIPSFELCNRVRLESETSAAQRVEVSTKLHRLRLGDYQLTERDTVPDR